ncbi:MAG TPA: protein-L-isoaspartate O-methyltransferase [Xanthobacteraceae bacterium]|jgi:protein-L-isoaspartate(D-aspartate) O-methyltransferase|nr:protein-L-isoaspartate O-methyltransferase [Xanthobacteraceae bacterium]
MVDFVRQRQAMVDGQIRVNDVTDPRIIEAMLSLPREQFVPRSRVDLAYIDEDIEIREAFGAAPARYLMEPMTLAKLVQALEIDSDDRALVIGCATGYSAALLARLAREVIALESEEALAAEARRVVKQRNVTFVNGALNAGWPYNAPYNAILLDGSVEFVPDAITAQLADGGRLVAVVGQGRAAKALLHVRSGGVVSARPLFDAAIPALPGFARPPQFVF